MSSTDERKIPKIVLKIGGGPGARTDNTISQEFDSIFSTKASEAAKDFYKTETNAISLLSLLKKINQNSYKSIENVLELMGRMNDVEKKKTLFQVLMRLKEIYLKFQLVLEWIKVSNEHLTLKIVKLNAKMAKDNLNRLIGEIYHNSNKLMLRNHSEPKFKALKDLLIVSDRVPSYFAPSIEALAPEKIETLNEKERNSWLITLESLLRTEISKNIVNIPKKDYRLLSIYDGKAKILFLNLFEFEFTLVPIIESFGGAWFILGVQVDSMKELFLNSLTGIFQFKYNNKSITDSQFFKAILSDCSKYVELFYYEKMFSQFSFLSNIYGKSICSFQKSPCGDWFKFKPWFLAPSDEPITVSFSNDSRFKVEGDVAKSIMIPSLSFDEKEAQMIFEQLFESSYNSKLKEFLKNQKSNGIINDFFLKGKFTFNIEIFEGYTMNVVINPFTKKFKFQLDLDNFDNFEENFENSFIEFNSELFNEVIFEVKKGIFHEIIKKSKYHEYLISDKATGLCLQLRDEPSLAFSVNFDSKLNSIFVKLWKIGLNYQNCFIDVKFKKIITETKSFEIPKTNEELETFLTEQKTVLLENSTKFSFENLIKSNGIEGGFVDLNNFKILSIGLPNCIKQVLLSSESDGTIVIELKGLQGNSINSKNINHLKGIVKLLSIYEHFNLIREPTEQDEMEIESFEPLRLKYQKTNFYLNETGKIEVSLFNELRRNDLESFIDSDDFNIYEFADKLLNLEFQESTRKDQEGSPDLTWLSDSFM